MEVKKLKDCMFLVRGRTVGFFGIGTRGKILHFDGVAIENVASGVYFKSNTLVLVDGVQCKALEINVCCSDGTAVRVLLPGTASQFPMAIAEAQPEDDDDDEEDDEELP
jgi:hypothetical protein